MMQTRTSRSHHHWLPSWDGSLREARGKGGATTTPTIPDELKPLISGSVQGVLGFQPQAIDYFHNLMTQGQNHVLQIAPLTGTEQGLVGLGDQALGYLGQSAPGFSQQDAALNLQGPLNQLASTQVATPEAEQMLTQAGYQGFDVLNQPIEQNPSKAQFYANLLGSQDLLGQRVGATAQEQGATTALNALPSVAGQGIATPEAEQQALQQIQALTSGAVGSSPSTQQAIAALEQQYQTRALPALQNQLAQAGLGRSGALEQGISDLRGQLFGAEVPLLQQEISNREQVLPILQSIAQAQQGRQTGTTDRLIQALSTQASGLTGLGGQLGARTQADLQRDTATRLGLSPQLLSQQGIETSAQMAPREQTLQYIQSLFSPLATLSSQQQTRSQIPIDRQLTTALQASPAFSSLNQGQIDMAKMLGEVGALPREQQQAINDAIQALDLRYQGLAESATLGPLDVMPSLIGSATKSSGGGMFGSALWLPWILGPLMLAVINAI